MNIRYLLLCATALLGACSTTDTRGPASASADAARVNAEITGTASYRERMTLPPGSMLEVVLEDVSRADAPADVISRTEVPADKAPPFSFALRYDPTRMNANHRYHVRARIVADDQLMFQSDAGYAVLGAGNVTHVDVLLRRASSETSKANPPAEQLRGMYTYMADAGWFVDCLSGVRLAVAQEGDNAALERGYSQHRSTAEAPLLATVQGRVEDRMPMEGTGPRPTLIVEKFVSVEADQGCSGPSSTAQLENTYWKLMTIDGKSYETPEGAREIHFVLRRQDFRIAGFAGCNQFLGSYQLNFDRITFSQMTGTMKPCPTGMDTERRIHGMFPRVSGWKINGETLQLTNEHGTPLATFESRHLQ